MYPGKYPSRAIFAAPSGEKDTIGNESTEMVEIGRAWVSLQALSGREILSAGGEKASVSHKLKTPTPAFEIPTSAQITVDGRIFLVETVLQGVSEPEMTLLCAEKRG